MQNTTAAVHCCDSIFNCIRHVAPTATAVFGYVSEAHLKIVLFRRTGTVYIVITAINEYV